MIGSQFLIGFGVYRDAYTKLQKIYGTKLNEKFASQFSGEDAKGIDCSLTYAQVMFLAFHYIGLMYKDIILGMSLTDAETKYNIPRLRYVLSCYKMYLSDFYDAFSITHPNAAPLVPMTTIQEQVMIGDMGGLTKILRFDGVNDTAIAPYNASNDITTGDFAIELRFKVHSFTGNPAIISNASGAVSGYEVAVTTDGGVRIKLYGEGLSISTTLGAGQITLNTWYHVTVCFDRDGVATLYVNGRIKDSATIAILSGKSLHSAHGLFIGHRDIDSVKAYMSIDRIRIYSKVFTAEEVFNLYAYGEIPLEHESYIKVRYDSEALGHYNWMDKGQYDNAISITGATLYNIPAGDVEVIRLQDITGDSSTSAIPSGYMLEKVIVTNSDLANSCTLDIGTTVGGNDVLTEISISPDSKQSYTIETYLGSAQLYVSGAWNGCTVTIDVYLKAL